MTDQQILSGAGPTPVAITLDVAQRLLPKLAFAAFDGTGAAGDFLPVVKFVGPGGLVAGQAVGDVVTAGASVDQTWFRGVEKQGSGNGWQFDTDNEGGWGYVQTNASISGISPYYDGAGLALVDGQADGIVIDSDSGVSINPVQNGSVTLGQLGNTQDVLLYGGGKVIDLSAPIGGGAHEKMIVQGPSATPVFTVDGDGNIDAGGNRIQNGADGVNPTDFATVEQVIAGGGVTSLDTITGAVTLVAGAGIAIADNTPTPGKIKISTSGVIGGPFTRGATSATFAASATSATVTVTHGLGVTPTAVTMQGDDNGPAFPVCVVKNLGLTTFQFFIRDPTGIPRTGTQIAYWVAFA